MIIILLYTIPFQVADLNTSNNIKEKLLSYAFLLNECGICNNLHLGGIEYTVN